MQLEERMELSIDETQIKKHERTRSDMVSKKLGELLLQRSRMLDATCDTCGCILMQKKDEPTYCVQCEDPAVKKFTETYLTVAQPAKELEVQEMIQQTMLQEPNKQQPTRVVNQAFSAPVEYTPNSSYASTIETLNSKIQWATSELKNSHIVRYNIELCEMINAASQAIVSLKSASAQS